MGDAAPEHVRERAVRCLRHRQAGQRRGASGRLASAYLLPAAVPPVADRPRRRERRFLSADPLYNLAFTAVASFVEPTFAAEDEGTSGELQALIETHETAIKRSIELFIERVAAGTTARWQSGMKSKHCWPSVPILRPAEATAGSRPTTC